jgi:hypothetical protein
MRCTRDEQELGPDRDHVGSHVGSAHDLEIAVQSFSGPRDAGLCEHPDRSARPMFGCWPRCSLQLEMVQEELVNRRNTTSSRTPRGRSGRAHLSEGGQRWTLPNTLSSTLAALWAGSQSRQTVRRWIANGKITAHRVGPRLIRVDLDEIESKIIHTVPTVSPDPRGCGRA